METDLSAETNPGIFRESARFVRGHCGRLLAISALVLSPVYWHRRIVSDDLGSHLYNAWLVQLIHRGQAPGLWIAPQWTNVLSDWMLSGLGSVFGLRVAERLTVSLAVLIFFWGVFALVCAASRRAPWFLLPLMGAVTYGYTFHMGFLNYYLAIGLSFWAAALFWRGKGWKRVSPLALAPLIVMAHPLGLIWLAGAVVYVGIAEAVPRQYSWALFVAAAAALAGVHFYFWHHYIVEAEPGRFYFFTGADQLVLFGKRYLILEWVLPAFALVALGADVARRRRERGFWRPYSIPTQLYLLALLAVPLLPRGIMFPNGTAPISLLTERMTSVSAAILLCILGAMRPSRWHLAGTAVIAAVFFAFMYQDTAVVNRMEAQIERLVRTLPPDQRVIGTILPPKGSRILIQHILDRACVGHCFSYGNYEPGSNVFRVRATEENPYVLSDYGDAVSTEHGDYIVESEDLPVNQVYQCSADGTRLCIHALKEGEENDSLGVHPNR